MTGKPSKSVASQTSPLNEGSQSNLWQSSVDKNFRRFVVDSSKKNRSRFVAESAAEVSNFFRFVWWTDRFSNKSAQRVCRGKISVASKRNFALRAKSIIGVFKFFERSFEEAAEIFQKEKALNLVQKLRARAFKDKH